LGLKGIGKKIYLILGFAISAVCLFFALRGIEWIQVASTFGKASLFGLVLSLLFQLVSLAVAGFRWKTVINLPEISWASASASMMVGLMVNNILPGRMGEIARPILLGQESKQSKAFLFATAVTDRLLDLLVLVILALLSFGMFPSIPWARQMSMIGGGVLILAVVLIGGFGYSTLGPKVEKMFHRLGPARFSERMAHTLQKFRLGFRSIGSIQRGVAVFGLSWLVWTAWFLGLYFCLNAFALSLPLWGMILLLCALNLAGLVPSSPGYAGTYHLLAILVLSYFAIKKEDALSFILVFHALWYIPQTLLGLIILAKKNLSLWQLVKVQE
jgi:glycosyltransferase 2 family protein